MTVTFKTHKQPKDKKTGFIVYKDVKSFKIPNSSPDMMKIKYNKLLKRNDGVPLKLLYVYEVRSK